MMRTTHRLAALATLAVLLAALPADAGLRHSFHPDGALSAEYVFLATEGGTIDGRFDVLETWKGKAPDGGRLTIPALAHYGDVAHRTVGAHFGEAPPGVVVSGKRMLLFLTRVEEAGAWGPSTAKGDIHASICWFEGGAAFANQQVVNPGPLRLVPVGTAQEIRESVRAALAQQKRLGELLDIPDAPRVVAEIPDLRPAVQRLAWDGLVALEGAALPAFEAFLEDDANLRLHDDALRALARIRAPGVDTLLFAIVRRETAYWKSWEAPDTAEALPRGDPARLHARRVQAVLNAIAGRGHREHVPHVAELFAALDARTDLERLLGPHAWPNLTFARKRFR